MYTIYSFPYNIGYCGNKAYSTLANRAVGEPLVVHKTVLHGISYHGRNQNALGVSLTLGLRFQFCATSGGLRDRILLC